jgi:hypothetical protein
MKNSLFRAGCELASSGFTNAILDSPHWAIDYTGLVASYPVHEIFPNLARDKEFFVVLCSVRLI